MKLIQLPNPEKQIQLLIIIKYKKYKFIHNIDSDLKAINSY